MSLGSAIYSAAMPALAYAAAPLFALSRRGKVRLRERYGYWNLPAGRYLWLHAASLGEMQGMIPLCRYLKARYPAKRLLVTATSPTGLEAGLPYADEARLLPFDSKRLISRALSGIALDGFVFGETELWPELLSFLEKQSVPRCLVNARISDASTGVYRALSSVFRPHIEKLSCVCAGDDDSMRRLLALGAPQGVVTLSGNAKFDRSPIITSPEMAQEVRELFMAGAEPVFVLASVHPEEAEVWMSAVAQAQHLSLRIVVAPRHSERFEFFAESLLHEGVVFERRSLLKEKRAACQAKVLLLDTLGELESVYSFSTAAFLGGTIRDLGGHNPLEAAMYGVYQCAGQSRWNIKDIAASLTKAGALETVTTTAEALSILEKVAADPTTFASKGAQAAAIVQQSRGATERIVAALKSAGALPR